MTRSSAQIRRDFIEFFTRQQGHTFAPSSAVVPHNDPTLLFANAGMNQFKDVFLGQGRREYTRAVNTQKCIRAGGKHNDLEDVGRDTYHHTFFEMLGNWSFGDYFKEEAIAWAWELLTSKKWWGLDESRLYVTVFAGDKEDGLAADEEAAAIWAKYVPGHRISRWGRKENFWEMGDTGPCGPCSEIHYDATPDGSGAALVNRGDPRVIEIWNLVFIQFNRNPGGKLSPLPARHVDTGMGFERVTRVIQGKMSNYDTDIWAPIFRAIAEKTGARPYGGSMDDHVDVAYRVIADHVRCLTVALTDGAAPGSEGRGYVLRRILRRAVRHARQTLGVNRPVLCEIVPAVVDSLGEAFPELRQSPDRVASVIRDEEEAFLRTLDRGLALFASAADEATAGGSKRISAGSAFRLHDTFGFPIDLTRLMAEERGYTVDEPGYEALMEEARERSRQGASADEKMTLTPDALAALERMGISRTDDIDKYHGRPLIARIEAIWNGRDFDESMHVSDRAALIVDRTNHYAESGGQVGDHGAIIGCSGPSCDKFKFNVEDTQAVGGYVLHIGRLVEGKILARQQAELIVNRERRIATMANHTSTHLLNHALRSVLSGEKVDQRGSLVAPDRLRFDFTSSGAMSIDQVAQVEMLVHRAIREDLPVDAENVPLESARRVSGVRAVFGERYPDPVRVVSIGAPVRELLSRPADPAWINQSIEFCGGTHLSTTGEIGEFVLLSEQGLAAGTRRITALSGLAAKAAMVSAQNVEQQIAGALAAPEDRCEEVCEQILLEWENLTIGQVARHTLAPRIELVRDRLKNIRKRHQASARTGAVDRAREIAERSMGPVIVEQIGHADRDGLMAALDTVRARRGEAAVLLFALDPEESRVSMVAAVPPAFVARGLKAGDWVREASRVCGGSGGGRPDMAQAGGKDPQRVPDAIDHALRYARERV